MILTECTLLTPRLTPEVRHNWRMWDESPTVVLHHGLSLRLEPSMPTPQRLQGIFTPNVVPLDDRGDINESETRRYVDWLIDHGVHGLYPNGSTGEFTRFTAEERRRIIEIIVDQTRGRVPVLAGAAEANTRETVAACEHYHSLGCRAVAIVAPFYYQLTPAGVHA